MMVYIVCRGWIGVSFDYVRSHTGVRIWCIGEAPLQSFVHGVGEREER
jgi:hypothetical protein